MHKNGMELVFESKKNSELSKKIISDEIFAECDVPQPACYIEIGSEGKEFLNCNDKPENGTLM